MPSRKVESHPNNPAYFVSCTDRLNLFEIDRLDAAPRDCNSPLIADNCLRRRATLKSSRPLAGLTCLDWCRDVSKPCVLGFGNNRGDVFVLNWDRNTETKISTPESMKRQCTDMVWSGDQGNKLAVGYEKARGQLAVVVYEISPYDINFQSPRAAACPPFSDTAASLAWVPNNSSLLAVGTMAGWIRVHDTRSGNLADMNILAHTDPKNRRVKGIRFDPFNEHVFASFSDIGNEPVKIWDMRKVEKSKDPRVLTIDPLQYMFGLDARGEEPKPNALVGEGVVDVEWSLVRQDILAVATSHDSRVLMYSTCKASNSENVSRVPLSELTVQAGRVTSLSWMKRIPVEPARASGDSSVSARGKGEVTSKQRLLIGTDAGVTDVCVVDSVPLAVSSNWSSAVVVVGAGSVITVHNSSSAGALGVSTSGAVSVDLSVKEPSHRRLHMSIEATESEFDEIESIEQRMVSMCKAGYAVDAGRNIQVISDKLDVLAYESPESFMKRSRMLLQLQRVWCWVDRVESMSILDPALSLQNCGVLQLIEAHGTSDVDSVANKGQLLDNMPCRVYESKNRKAARSVCGWATLKLTMDASVSPTASAEEDPHEATYLDLEDLVEEYVKYDTFERACALALWHGDLNLAVEVLRRTMEHLSTAPGSADLGDSSPWQMNKKEFLEEEDEEMEVESMIDLSHISLEYQKLVPLVAMCLAGFPKDDVLVGAGTGSGSKKIKKDGAKKEAPPSQSLWPSMCRHLIGQLRLVTERPSVCYLIGACEFLLCLLTQGSATPKRASTTESTSPAVLQYSSVLYSEDLAVEDRCGFACTYLSPPDLVPYLKSLQSSCLNDCDIEGVILMGLNSTPHNADNSGGFGGLHLLQKYLDSRYDIQTVALLVSRLPLALTTSPNSEYSLEGEWLTCYRNLLNRWKLYMERASLDVELGKRFRQLKAQTSATDSLVRKASGQAGLSAPPETAKVVYPLPQHMDDVASHMCMKCTYCSVALPVDPMDKKHSSSVWMRRQRPLMNCCPNCKKPLPRCYVCLFFTGVLNPQMELKVIAKRREIEHSVANLLTKPTPATATVAPALAGSTGIMTNEKLASLEAIDQNLFDQGKWFMWCQRCKHGGHAGCLDKWFSEGSRRICGVNGCSCKCSISSL